MQPAQYQQDVAAHIYERDSSLIFARPGTGKTLATLLALKDWIKEGVAKRVLIVAPLRVAKLVWGPENVKWNTGLSMALVTGEMSLKERNQAIYCGSDVLVTNFEMLEKVLETNHGCDAIVIDEISKLRSHTGVWNKAVRKAKFKLATGLTGTPTPNTLLSLHGIARAVGIDAFDKSFDKWKRQFFYPTDYMGYKWAPLPGAREQLQALLKPYTYVLDEGAGLLPPVVRVPVPCALPPDVRAAYATMRRTCALTDHDIVAGNAGVATGKLRQIAAGFVYDNAGGVVPLSSFRIDVLADLVEELSGEPLMVVYEWREQLAQLLARWPGTPFLGGGSEDDDATAAAWNDRKLPLLFLHPAAAGHGLNMAAGGCSIAWMQPPNDNEFYSQTIGRLRRRDQTAESVFSYEIVAADTLDGLVRDRLDERTAEQDRLWSEMKNPR